MSWWGPQGMGCDPCPMECSRRSLVTAYQAVGTPSWGSGERWEVFEQGYRGFGPRLLGPGLMGRHEHNVGWEKEMFLHKILRK